MSEVFSYPVRYMVVKRWFWYSILDTNTGEANVVSSHLSLVCAHLKARRMNIDEGYTYGF